MAKLLNINGYAQRVANASTLLITTLLMTVPLIAVFLMTSLLMSFKANAQEGSLKLLADNLKVQYQVVSNLQNEHCEALFKGPCFEANLRFDLEPAQSFEPFALYFSHIAPIRWDNHHSLNIEHINGDLHQIIFNGDEFLTDASLSVTFKAAFWHAAHSDIMPNYFVHSIGNKATGYNQGPFIVASTKAGFDELTGLQTLNHLKPHRGAEQYRRFNEDNLAFADASWLFHHYKQMKRDEQLNKQKAPAKLRDASNRIIPKLQNSKWSAEAKLDLTGGIRLNWGPFAPIPMLEEMLIDAGLSFSESGTPVNILLAGKNNASASAKEAYQLNIDKQQISIAASNRAGLSYGFVSLYQLLKTQGLKLPTGEATDNPRFGFRGVHVDLSRNFLGKDVVMHLIEQMFQLKLNKLHLHLADDEGWRLEIPALPELTQIGAYRCFELAEEQCLLPQLGSGPFREQPTNGFLTTDEYKDILRFAHERQIEVIPSFDMPGHARAAVKAMEARYRKYKALEQTEKAEEFLLSDFLDDTEYLSVQFYKDNTVNPCIDSTYHFIDTVIGYVKSIHKSVDAPLTTYHIGADETSGAWVNSTVCKQLIDSNDHLKGVDDLKPMFLSRVIHIIEQHGLQAAGWSDGMHKVLDAEAEQGHQVNVWDTLFWDGHEKAREFSDKGWKTVLSIPDVNYFDFPYANHPAEPGYYWAAKNTDSFKVFQFMPENLEANAGQWLDRMGNPYEVTVKHENVLSVAGMQTQIWTESVRNVETFQHLMYPRLLAFAERAWHQADWEAPVEKGTSYTYDKGNQVWAKQQRNDWQDFTIALLNYLESGLLGSANLRVPPPGLQWQGEQLLVNVPWQKLTVQCRSGDSQWQVIEGSSSQFAGADAVTCRSWLPFADKYSREVIAKTAIAETESQTTQVLAN